MDNQATMNMMVKGWSRVQDTNDLVDACWLAIAKSAIDVHFVYVASKAKLADGPSRRDLSLLRSLESLPQGAVWPRVDGAPEWTSVGR